MARDYHRLTVRLDLETYERLLYHANKDNISANEYVRNAIERQIRVDVGDFDIPNMGIVRLNQLIDHILSLSADVKNLEDITISSFEALLNLTRGDNYLYDYDEEM